MTGSKIFKINRLVDLRLIGKRTYIYVNNEMFLACLRLIMNIPINRIQEANEINSIDEATEIFNSTENWQNIISPEEEFKAHCSNIQAFFENGLNTDILASNVAFPLLKKLVDHEYKPAIRVFKEEIVKRYNEGTFISRFFLSNEGYLNYLSEEEKQLLKELNDTQISHWKLKLELSKLKKKERKMIRCPMCNAIGKKNFVKVEDKSKILSYVSLVPIYAKKHICKRCGYEF